MRTLTELPPVVHKPGDTILARHWFRWAPATILETVDRPATNLAGEPTGGQLRGYIVRFLPGGLVDSRLTTEVKEFPRLDPARYPLRQTRALVAAFRTFPAVFPTTGPERVHPATLRALARRGFAAQAPGGVWEATRAGRDAFLALVPVTAAWELVRADLPADGDLYEAAGRWVGVIGDAQARVREVAAEAGEFIPHLVTVARVENVSRGWSSNGAHERWISRPVWWVRCHTCGHVVAVDGTAGAARARGERAAHLVVG
ncbi:hypothetical protein [Nocardiopsis sp. FR26]|uniref:hypothetical protein n=1 Tax=Nocardiopsis sp. FR26 TaxID=2605987 RepID=UPI0013591E7D|nr:hypothetical protein [Nocardiopsis sp. FR26]